MAVFFNLLSFGTVPVMRRESRFATAAARMAAAVGEIGLFLWMILALASLLGVMAGFLV